MSVNINLRNVTYYHIITKKILIITIKKFNL